MVLITGAARRIGAAIARALHADGCNVLIHARGSIAEAHALVSELNAARADSATALCADLREAAQIERLAAAAHARWQRLDALVNNASTYYRTPFGSIGAEQIDDLLATNLRAPLLLAQACAARLADGGSIVNIIDAQARHGVPGFAPYIAAKAGLWTLTQTLALELAPRLRVNGVAPGHMVWATSTALSAAEQARELQRVPLRRLGGADEVARAVRWLLSADAAYVTGVVLPVDGGLRLS
ncbi:SDR family oxidoreductase [Fontimonas sp. SYSU GA230001]|uniref:SDR family oxidoreductase n=1 Tax=Fontimonas sp. SYSU GA230001 TaxID=3142450 RepID=UPI0032B48A54